RSANVVNEDVQAAVSFEDRVNDHLDAVRSADIRAARTYRSDASVLRRSERAVVATLAPAAARRDTIAAPTPSEPPVTSVRLSASSVGSIENFAGADISQSPCERSFDPRS